MSPKSIRKFLRARLRPNRQYTYEALPTTRSIRLVKFTPSTPETTICTLKIVSLDEAPKYTALSYCWGAREGTIPIACGKKRDIVYITPNLYFYFKHLSRRAQKDIPEYLWIDVLCINQADDVEKSSQVSIMRDIYKQAEKVEIWLGEGTEKSNMAMNWMLRMDVKDLLAMISDFSALPKDSDEDINKDRERYAQYKPSGPEWDAIVSLLNLPWFQRVWVIQEKVMARRTFLVCGNVCLDWLFLLPIVYFTLIFGIPLKHDSEVEHGPLDTIRKLIYIMGFESQPPRLLKALDSCIDFLATDLRDKVFALLGFVDESGYDKAILKPDYGMSLTEVFSKCALAIMSAEKSLDVLSQPRPKTDLNLPSWAPDWTRKGKMLHLSVHIIVRAPEERMYWKASGDSRSNARSTADGRMLALTGLVADRIESTATVLHTPYHFGTFQSLLSQTETLLDWETFSQRKSEVLYDPTWEAIADVYHSLLTAGQALHKGHSSRDCFLEWEELRLPRKVARPNSATEAEWLTELYLREPESTRNKYARCFQLSIANNRRLIRTESGYLGLAPAETEVGDVVTICQGGCVPLIFRSHGDNFELVGDAYVHGMMHGERYEESKCKIMWLV